MQEGLYYTSDSIPFPPGHVSFGKCPPLSRYSVLAAEQIILRVMKMTVPVCHFAQFSRPLWHRFMMLDDELWRQQLSGRSNIPRPESLSSQAKQASSVIHTNSYRFSFNNLAPLLYQALFRFIHHASSRHTDCSKEGFMIHPSIKAICVSILSIALCHVVNLKYKEKFLSSGGELLNEEKLWTQEASEQQQKAMRSLSSQLHNVSKSPTSSISSPSPTSSHPFSAASVTPFSKSVPPNYPSILLNEPRDAGTSPATVIGGRISDGITVMKSFLHSKGAFLSPSRASNVFPHAITPVDKPVVQDPPFPQYISLDQLLSLIHI